MIFILDIDEIRTLLNSCDATFEFIKNEQAIHSVDDAKGYYEACQTAPILIITTEMGYFALIKAGDRERVDFEQLKKVLQCERVKLASRKQVLKITGYEVGNVPLVGHQLPVILDGRLLQQPFVFGGVGNANFTLKIDSQDLEKINKVVAKIDS